MRRLPMIVFTALLVCASSVSLAQTKVYQCKNENGVMVMSDQPCGNVISTKTYNLPDADTDFSNKPQWYRYLTPTCKGRADALAARNFRSFSLDTRRSLVGDFLSLCGREIERANEDIRNEARGYKPPVGVKSNRPPPEQSADEKSRELCADLGANLKQRRARTEANPTEDAKADLKKFEATYEQRCKRPSAG